MMNAIEICSVLAEWYKIKNSEMILTYRKKPYENKIYNWLIDGDKLDLYKYCILINTAIKQKQKHELFVFLNYKRICYSYFHFNGLIHKYMVKYYKGKYYDVNSDTHNNYIYDNYIYDNYSGYLFGERVISIDKYYKHLNKHQAIYLLYRHNFIQNAQIEIPVTKYVIKYARFILECKKLGINEEMIKNKTKISLNQYNLITRQYYEYLKYGTKDSYEEYLAKKQYKTDSIACMEYLRAVYNTSLDLNGDVIISADSIKQIMVIANVNEHLNKID